MKTLLVKKGDFFLFTENGYWVHPTEIDIINKTHSIDLVYDDQHRKFEENIKIIKTLDYNENSSFNFKNKIIATL